MFHRGYTLKKVSVATGWTVDENQERVDVDIARQGLTASRSVFRRMRNRVPVTQCVPFDALQDILNSLARLDTALTYFNLPIVRTATMKYHGIVIAVFF